MIYHTRLIIDLRAYRENIRRIKRMLGGDAGLCAVVKADAYGHGLQWIAPAAVDAGADLLGVVDNWEVERIRREGLTVPVMRLRPALADEAAEAAPWGVEELTGSLDHAEALSRVGERLGAPIRVHVKIDVGMGRMGLPPRGREAAIARIASLPGLRVAGVMTHFPSADEDDETITQTQLAAFRDEWRRIAPMLPSGVRLHCANSAAAARFSEARLTMARAGVMTYGLSPAPGFDGGVDLSPVMSWTTRIVQVRDVERGAGVGYGMTHRMPYDGCVALLPIGYADGYLRDFSNRARVLIRGESHAVIGRVSMNLTTVDVTGSPDVAPGDEAVMIGRQGDERITAAELADWGGTIDYEIACLVGRCNSHQVKVVE
ncbi:MAG: alanine racemase [bacterium]|nr:alanine racemase [bacterium]